MPSIVRAEGRNRFAAQFFHSGHRGGCLNRQECRGPKLNREYSDVIKTWQGDSWVVPGDFLIAGLVVNKRWRVNTDA